MLLIRDIGVPAVAAVDAVVLLFPLLIDNVPAVAHVDNVVLLLVPLLIDNVPAVALVDRLFDLFPSTSAFLRAMATRALHQQAAHRLGRGGKEMSARIPILSLLNID